MKLFTPLTPSADATEAVRAMALLGAAVFVVSLGYGAGLPLLQLYLAQYLGSAEPQRVARHIGMPGGVFEYVLPHFFAAVAMTLYLISTSVSLAPSTHQTVKLCGVPALLTFGAAYYFYSIWFISVWCLFTALMSVVFCLHFVPTLSFLRETRS